ncbi:MAG: RdgB/HAM1 family non-canonical purine NTP pyrophosphatase [Anaerolineae bacterium]
MLELLVATQNKGKVREYQRLLDGLDVRVIGLGDVGLDQLDVEEVGTTFAVNALIKAQAYAEASGHIALADDSGLVVDALDGAPGVYSARYGEAHFDDAGRRAYLLEQLRDVPAEARSARFRCVIAIYDPYQERAYTVSGACEGQILNAERDGGQGFGYDAVFQPAGYSISFAELPAEEKNRISHRGVAAHNLPAILAQLQNKT